MEVVLSEQAVRFLRDCGGRLYVWPRISRCCNGVTYLRASTEPSRKHEFRRVATEGFEVFMPAGLTRLPQQLHVELRRFPRRRVEAYWEGCAWVDLSAAKPESAAGLVVRSRHTDERIPDVGDLRLQGIARAWRQRQNEPEVGRVAPAQAKPLEPDATNKRPPGDNRTLPSRARVDVATPTPPLRAAIDCDLKTALGICIEHRAPLRPDEEVHSGKSPLAPDTQVDEPLDSVPGSDAPSVGQP